MDIWIEQRYIKTNLCRNFFLSSESTVHELRQKLVSFYRSNVNEVSSHKDLENSSYNLYEDMNIMCQCIIKQFMRISI